MLSYTIPFRARRGENVYYILYSLYYSIVHYPNYTIPFRAKRGENVYTLIGFPAQTHLVHAKRKIDAHWGTSLKLCHPRLYPSTAISVWRVPEFGFSRIFNLSRFWRNWLQPTSYRLRKKQIRYYFIGVQVCCSQRPRRARALQRSRGHVPYLRLVCTSLMHLLALGSAPPPKKRPICLVTMREKSEKYNRWAGNDIQPSSSTNI